MTFSKFGWLVFIAIAVWALSFFRHDFVADSGWSEPDLMKSEPKSQAKKLALEPVEEQGTEEQKDESLPTIRIEEAQDSRDPYAKYRSGSPSVDDGRARARMREYLEQVQVPEKSQTNANSRPRKDVHDPYAGYR